MLKKTAVTLELTSIFSSFAFRSFLDIFCAFHFFVFYKSHKKSAKIFTLYFAKEWHILTNFGADFAHFLTNLLLKATKKGKVSACRPKSAHTASRERRRRSGMSGGIGVGLSVIHCRFRGENERQRPKPLPSYRKKEKEKMIYVFISLFS